MFQLLFKWLNFHKDNSNLLLHLLFYLYGKWLDFDNHNSKKIPNNIIKGNKIRHLMISSCKQNVNFIKRFYKNVKFWYFNIEISLSSNKINKYFFGIKYFEKFIYNTQHPLHDYLNIQVWRKGFYNWKNN